MPLVDDNAIYCPTSIMLAANPLLQRRTVEVDRLPRF
jgi:hypothetical protein